MLMNSQSGCLLIDKNIGYTSRDEVNIVSKTLNTKKVGHIGTLDPFADGLLVVMVGSATKISPFLEVMDKTYLATLKLGEKTNTADLTGEVIETKDVPSLTKEKITEVFNSFLGDIEQIPPMHSAIKINGVKLYKLAHKGQEIERKPRVVHIYELTLVNHTDNEITFITKVSKGTYIRTLGEDIANKLNTVGHLTKLTRVAVGPYSLKDAIKSKDSSVDKLIPIEKMLSHLPMVELEGDDIKKALNGCTFKINTKHNKVLVKDKDGIIAMYEKIPNGYFSCVRGLR